MKVIYIAGPFRGPNHWAIAENIRNAERLAFEVWKRGAVAICPHLNTAHFQDALPDHMYLDGDLELVLRSDAILLTPDWERSQGAKAEVLFAQYHNIPVIYTLMGLEKFLEHGVI